MSGAAVGAIFLVMTVAYVFLKSSSSVYPAHKRQVLRRRAWFKQEKARRLASAGGAKETDLREWYNPTFTIARTVELPVGVSLEFENDPPLLQRKYAGKALLRVGEPNEAEVIAEIMEPRPSNDNPVLRVLIRRENSGVANPGDSFHFLANPKLR